MRFFQATLELNGPANKAAREAGASEKGRFKGDVVA